MSAVLYALPVVALLGVLCLWLRPMRRSELESTAAFWRRMALRAVWREDDAAEAEVARLRAIVEGRTTAPTRAILPVYVNPGCHSDDDGDCVWSECPQLRDGEPKATGRHCPRDMRGDE